MDSFVDLWVSSGKNRQRLYHGSTDDIFKELKAWVERRKAHNDVSMDVSWNMFCVADSLQQLSHHLREVPQRQVPGMMGQVPAITATQMDNLDRKRVSHLPTVEVLNTNLDPRILTKRRKERHF